VKACWSREERRASLLEKFSSKKGRERGRLIWRRTEACSKSHEGEETNVWVDRKKKVVERSSPERGEISAQTWCQGKAGKKGSAEIRVAKSRKKNKAKKETAPWGINSKKRGHKGKVAPHRSPRREKERKGAKEKKKREIRPFERTVVPKGESGKKKSFFSLRGKEILQELLYCREKNVFHCPSGKKGKGKKKKKSSSAQGKMMFFPKRSRFSTWRRSGRVYIRWRCDTRQKKKKKSPRPPQRRGGGP